jgi:hypothetical protein
MASEVIKIRLGAHIVTMSSHTGITKGFSRSSARANSPSLAVPISRKPQYTVAALLRPGPLGPLATRLHCSNGYARGKDAPIPIVILRHEKKKSAHDRHIKAGVIKPETVVHRQQRPHHPSPSPPYNEIRSRSRPRLPLHSPSRRCLTWRRAPTS